MAKLRLPRKIVLIGAGAVVLCGATGATAYFIGRDAILGPSEEDLAGIACTDVVRVADLRKGRGPWLRKFVKVAPGTDGLARAKTAIRVAAEIQKTLPADLIEIVVLDQNGPDQRAFMRGRAVGAEVILVKDPADLPGVTGKYTVNYYQGVASGTGQFYGEAATMTSQQAEEIASKMDKLSDCAPPPEKVDAGEKKPAHGKKEAPKHGGEAKSGEAKAGEGEAKAGEHGADAASAEGGHAAAPAAEEKSPGFMSKMLGMVGLGGSKEVAADATAHGGDGQSAAPVEAGHESAAPSDSHGHAGQVQSPGEAGATSHEAAPTHGDASSTGGADGHNAAPAEGGHEAAAPSAGHGDAGAPHPEPAPAHGEAAAAPSGGEAPASDGGDKSFMSKMLGYVGLAGKDKPKTLIEHSGGPAIVSGTPKVQGQ